MHTRSLRDLPGLPTRAVTTIVDIKHSTLKSLSTFLRVAEKRDLLKLEDARPDVVVAYRLHQWTTVPSGRKTSGGDKRRNMKRSELLPQQMPNTEKRLTVMEL